MNWPPFYILDGHRPVPVEDALIWSEWFVDADRTVAKTWLAGMEVSTMFIGLDHNFGDGPPLLFETIIFGNDVDDEPMWRYATWEEAEAGHAQQVARIEAAIDSVNKR